MLPDRTTGPATRTRLRPEIQGLRALAVGMVVLNHLWPRLLPGGFVGVDVFFVVSGYLITGHLVRELDASGRLDLVSFWGRRVRRLLPASLLVLAVAVVLVLSFVPAPLWPNDLWQVLASASYVQNVHLAASSVDYFAAEDTAGVVQHYWSLSVEEQFYVVWPLVLAVTAGLSARLARRRALEPAVGGAAIPVTRAVTLAVLVVGGTSWIVSLVRSYGPEADAAYFSTTVRAWEFMAGAALVASGRALDRLRSVRGAGLLGWAGFATVVAAGVLLRPGTAYPGLAALLPVAGTVLVIAAGDGDRGSFASVARWRPVQHLGRISYSVYLWHWPLIVVAPFALAGVGGFGRGAQVAVLPVTYVLAVVTTYAVEDRFRTAPPALAGRRRILLVPVAGVAASALVVASVFGFVVEPNARHHDELLTTARQAGCLGADAIVNRCADPFGPRSTLDGATASVDRVAPCGGGGAGRTPTSDEKTVASCEFDVDGATAGLAVVGDSHAQIVSHYVAEWGATRSTSVVEYATGACPVIVPDVRLAFPNGNRATSTADARSWTACTDYSRSALDEIERRGDLDTVLLTNSTTAYLDRDDPGSSALTTRSVDAVISSLTAAGKHVIVMRDVPGMAYGDNASTCVAQHLERPQECRVPRADVVVRDDPMVRAADETGAPVIDLTDAFCDQSFCYAAVGGVVAYWDRAHLTATMADTLRPQLVRQLERGLLDGAT